jgi:hypothetical protein
MAEHGFNSSSTNPASPLASSPCGEWEVLLVDALDGLLRPEDEAAFTAHRALCPACAALYEEARRGREWLEFLSPEPEAPEGLLAKILARTGPGVENLGLEISGLENPGLESPGLENSGQQGLGRAADRSLAGGGGSAAPKSPVFIPAFTPASAPASIPAWQRPSFLARIQRFAEPRLMMTAAMAFFSIAMTLNLTGLRLSRLPLSELRPSAVGALPGSARAFLERRLTAASTPIIRFYDHSRLVYEVQATVRELRRTTEAGGEGRNEEDRRGPQALTPGESKEASLNNEQRYSLQEMDKSVFRPAFALNLSPTAQPTGNNSDFYETAARFNGQPARSGGSAIQKPERSTVWTAQITRA